MRPTDLQMPTRAPFRVESSGLDPRLYPERLANPMGMRAWQVVDELTEAPDQKIIRKLFSSKTSSLTIDSRGRLVASIVWTPAIEATKPGGCVISLPGDFDVVAEVGISPPLEIGVGANDVAGYFGLAVHDSADALWAGPGCTFSAVAGSTPTCSARAIAGTYAAPEYTAITAAVGCAAFPASWCAAHLFRVRRVGASARLLYSGDGGRTWAPHLISSLVPATGEVRLMIIGGWSCAVEIEDLKLVCTSLIFLDPTKSDIGM